jgi:hypothetical protein
LVVKLGHIRLHGGDVGADELHRLVERGLAPAEDQHVRALLHEPLRDGEPDAARTAADDCDLAFKFSANDDRPPIVFAGHRFES